MNEQTLFEAGFRRWEMLLAAWNFYLLIAVGTIVLFAAVRSLRHDRRVYWIFTVGFAFFAWTHLLGLLYILKQWHAIAEELKRKLEQSDPSRIADLTTRFEYSGIIDAPEAIWVLPFHLLGDAFVLASLWWLRPAVPPAPKDVPPSVIPF